MWKMLDSTFYNLFLFGIKNIKNNYIAPASIIQIYKFVTPYQILQIAFYTAKLAEIFLYYRISHKYL